MNTAYAVAQIPGRSADYTFDPIRNIDTRDLSLRVIEIEDLENYGKLLRDPAVMRFVGLDAGKLIAEEELESLVTGAVNAWETRGYGRWSIFDKATGEFMGFCGFRCEQGFPEFLCMLFEQHWGRGAATAAAAACIDYGFTQLGFSKVLAFTRPENTRARRLVDKIGATFTGYVDFHGVTGAAYEIVREPSPVNAG